MKTTTDDAYNKLLTLVDNYFVDNPLLKARFIKDLNGLGNESTEEKLAKDIDDDEIVKDYNELTAKENEMVKAYNAQVDEKSRLLRTTGELKTLNELRQADIANTKARSLELNAAIEKNADKIFETLDAPNRKRLYSHEGVVSDNPLFSKQTGFKIGYSRR